LLRSLESQSVEGQHGFAVDANKLLARFTVEAIASTVLGTTSDDEVAKVEKIVKKVIGDLSNVNGFQLLLSSFAPRLFKTKIFQADVDDFFDEIVQQKHKGLIGALDAHKVPAQLLIFFAGG
jgi:hypothetical protein